MEVAYLQKALDDLKFWRNSGNKNVQKRITQLIDAIQKSPYEGIGQPEPLKYNLEGKWSRRINHEHRMVYEVNEEKIFIYSLKGHYDK